MKIRVLFVDDEPRVLEALERMLRTMRHEWEMAFAQSGRQALNILNDHPFDVVVSDIRMPGIDGPQLLAEVMERHPRAVRIVLSGQSSPKAALRCVRGAHQFLAKPCSVDTLKFTIERACALRGLLENECLRKIVSQMASLPSAPSLYVELMKELRSPDASVLKAGETISKDVGMTAKILQLVNSPFFGFYKPVSSAVRAVSLLGLETIKALVLSSHIFSQFEGMELRGFSLDRLWEHSIRMGTLAREISRQEDQEQVMIEDAFMAGILHDSGKLVLAANLPKRYCEALTRAQDDKIALWEAELVVFETTHAQVGAYLMGLWGLPDPIVEAIAFHHNPSKCFDRSFSPLTAVHVANTLDHEEELSDAGEVASQIDTDYLCGLGKMDRIPQWRETCRHARDKEEADEQ